MNASGVKWVSVIVSDECSFGMLGLQIKTNKQTLYQTFMNVDE